MLNTSPTSTTSGPSTLGKTVSPERPIKPLTTHGGRRYSGHSRAPYVRTEDYVSEGASRTWRQAANPWEGVLLGLDLRGLPAHASVSIGCQSETYQVWIVVSDRPDELKYRISGIKRRNGHGPDYPNKVGRPAEGWHGLPRLARDASALDRATALAPVVQRALLRAGIKLRVRVREGAWPEGLGVPMGVVV